MTPNLRFLVSSERSEESGLAEEATVLSVFGLLGEEMLTSRSPRTRLFDGDEGTGCCAVLILTRGEYSRDRKKARIIYNRKIPSVQLAILQVNGED